MTTIEELQRQLEELEALEDAEEIPTPDESDSPPIKYPGNFATYKGTSPPAQIPKGYTASISLLCHECGVPYRRFAVDRNHPALMDYCSLNCMEDALTRGQILALLTREIAAAVDALADPARRDEHPAAWARLQADAKKALQEGEKDLLTRPLYGMSGAPTGVAVGTDPKPAP